MLYVCNGLKIGSITKGDFMLKMRKKLPNNYEGYLLQSYSQTIIDEDTCECLFEKLKTIPKKVKAFIETANIQVVYKVNNFLYYVVLNDGNVYALEY